MQRESITELLSQFASASASLVRDEIDLAKQEVREAAIAMASGVAVLTAGAIIGLVAFMVLCAAVVIGLSSVMSPGLAALLTGIGLAGLAGVLALVGLKLIKKSHLKPQQTIQSLKETKQWLKEMT